MVLAHADRNPDPVLHAELAAIGAYLGYDGFARSRILPDSALIDCLAQAIELGAGDQARAAVAHGLEFMCERFWDARSGGWFRTTDDDGHPLDRHKDVYDQAFAIFALFRVFLAVNFILLPLLPSTLSTSNP